MLKAPWDSLCRPAALRHQVILQSRTKTRNGAGGFTEAWVPIATVRAAIWMPEGQQGNVQGETTVIRKGVVAVRSRSDMTAPIRVVFGSRTFEGALALLPNESRYRGYAGIDVVERVT